MFCLWSIESSEIVRNYAIVVGGAVGLGLAIWRGVALSRQSKASVDQAKTARRAHVTELFGNAVGQLNSDRIEIRLGAIFTLRQISQEFPSFERDVIDVFAAYVRERTANVNPAETPTQDVQEIMRFLQKTLSREHNGT